VTVGELIAELQRYDPLKPAVIVIADVDGTSVQADADVVIYEGSHVAIEG